MSTTASALRSRRLPAPSSTLRELRLQVRANRWAKLKELSDGRVAVLLGDPQLDGLIFDIAIYGRSSSLLSLGRLSRLSRNSFRSGRDEAELAFAELA